MQERLRNEARFPFPLAVESSTRVTLVVIIAVGFNLAVTYNSTTVACTVCASKCVRTSYIAEVQRRMTPNEGFFLAHRFLRDPTKQTINRPATAVNKMNLGLFK